MQLLHGASLDRQPRRKQRGQVYGIAMDDVLRVMWENLDCVCAERLTPALVETAEQLARHGELARRPSCWSSWGGSAWRASDAD